jgi:hypothetical protein
VRSHVADKPIAYHGDICLYRTNQSGDLQGAMVARFTDGKLVWLRPLADYPEELSRGSTL